jgi:hypothetical protein
MSLAHLSFSEFIKSTMSWLHHFNICGQCCIHLKEMYLVSVSKNKIISTFAGMKEYSEINLE